MIKILYEHNVIDYDRYIADINYMQHTYHKHRKYPNGIQRNSPQLKFTIEKEIRNQLN
jgi:hypothetical protein